MADPRDHDDDMFEDEERPEPTDPDEGAELRMRALVADFFAAPKELRA